MKESCSANEVLEMLNVGPMEMKDVAFVLKHLSKDLKEGKYTASKDMSNFLISLAQRLRPN